MRFLRKASSSERTGLNRVSSSPTATWLRSRGLRICLRVSNARGNLKAAATGLFSLLKGSVASIVGQWERAERDGVAGSCDRRRWYADACSMRRYQCFDKPVRGS